MHAELRAIFGQDQGDRSSGRSWEEISARDRARRARVEALMAADELRVGVDYFHAAMVFQHGERLEDYRRAHELAKRAAELGYRPGRWLAAAAYDRWLVHQGKPQKYGTQYRSDDGEAFRLEEVDPATTDEERAEWDVPPLAEAQRMAEHMRPRAAPRDPSLVVTFLNPGIRFEVRETDEEPADAVPVPAALPDGLTPCRLGKEYGATTSEGQVALTWRRCRWRAEVDEGVPGYDPRHASPGNITIGPPGETHCKLVLFAGPETCWLVEGDFGRDELVRIATSLPA